MQEQANPQNLSQLLVKSLGPHLFIRYLPSSLMSQVPTLSILTVQIYLRKKKKKSLFLQIVPILRNPNIRKEDENTLNFLWKELQNFEN